MTDFMGLKKLEKDLNKSLSFDIFDEKKEKQTRSKFHKPKAKYTHQQRPDYSREIKQAKKIAKETKSAFGTVIEKIKNRKIHKLEKQAIKAQAKANKLAHEIKTKTALIDSLTDIKRYNAELEKVNEELEETTKGKQENG